MTVHESDSDPPETSIPLQHLGIILDGNRRWARDRRLPAAAHGHRAGFSKIPEVLTWCMAFDISIVTLWMLSDDNITNRSAAELDDLYRIDEEIIAQLTETGSWRLHHIGRTELLPERLTGALHTAEQVTRDRPGPLVNLAIGYGGRSDVLAAVRTLLQQVKDGADPDAAAERLADHLSTAGQPDPDLIIRTSGEHRTSGFMLWQAALAEWYFSDRLWPDFSRDDLAAVVDAYRTRRRRFGS
ncbi:polyprenyl diphosphate synthase [Kitasatospora sp. NPDC048540]|uniref:polyprenyl diphosphate synthase n=1 Tax=unclassified Kitasatospora TaxID=2633591 RepID=UPI00053B7809|nr:polyprenyl diphosphate synthase [Kitasatospora sp. MBT63]